MKASDGTIGRVFFGGAASAFVLTLCLSALPLWAAQAQQEDKQESEQVEQSADETAPPQENPAPQNPEYQRVPQKLTLSAGTVITIRTSQFLSSDQSRPGDGFTGELQQPVVVDGWVLARRGQTVLGRVAVAQKAGRAKGTSQLGVELSHLVLVDGQQIRVRSQLLQTSAGTSQGRDAQAVGTSTGIGAVVGAAADGGKGAGIGAAIGAGAGLAGVLLTRGRPTEIPPETALTFELENPVTISTARSGPAFRPVAPEDYDGGSLRRRTDHFATRPERDRPGIYYPYGPWGYGYPGPYFFSVTSFGRRWGHRGHHFGH